MAEPRESFHYGTQYHLQEVLGGRLTESGAFFSVWAPNAVSVSVTGDFCSWDPDAHPMHRESDGVWTAEIPGLRQFDLYKYAIKTHDGQTLYKADPMAYFSELRPGTASSLYALPDYRWRDESYMEYRRRRDISRSPMNVYELHAGSWRRRSDGSFYTWRELAGQLIPYVKRMCFTHIELLPVTEHPLDASWGYQCTGYFAATSRFGTPEDFMFFVDSCHAAGIGVILDWVPAHFPKDPHGLVEFDGTRCYEYQDHRRAEMRGWGTRMFDLGRGEVRSFLISSALFWLDKFHADGLRVDACAAMLYLDYDRSPGDWEPNIYGGHENLQATDFFRQLSSAVSAYDKSVLLIAEESTAWPNVTSPPESGGLGFALKWNMGWMHDTLHYFGLDPIYRQYNHRDITFSLVYAFSERFMLPLSHDEVVHMKGSLMGKMPGDEWQKNRSLRLLYAYMLAHPGKKLIFMGAELGQYREWDYDSQLSWELLERGEHSALQAYFAAANEFYLSSPELWEQDFVPEGFRWMRSDDYSENTAAFMRRDRSGNYLICVFNFSPVPRHGYFLEVPDRGDYDKVFSSIYDTGQSAFRARFRNGRLSILADIPPLCAVFIKKRRM